MSAERIHKKSQASDLLIVTLDRGSKGTPLNKPCTRPFFSNTALFISSLLSLIVFPLYSAPPTVTPQEVEKKIEEKLLSVAEFRFIRQTADDLGIRVWLFGGTASGFGHYAKWDLQREKGDNRFQKDRFDYDYTNIFRSTQDLDLVVDGSHEAAETLRRMIATRFPYFQGGKSAWEVRLLRDSTGNKDALLKNKDFLEQHTDSNSTGMIELTKPNDGQSSIRDLRDWDSKSPQFLKDIAEGKLHYYFSPTHSETRRAKEGVNPPIFSVIRYLTKVFQYELEIRAEDIQKIRDIIRTFDPSTVGRDYVGEWIEKNGKKLVQNAVNIEYALKTLNELGLAEKLIQIRKNARMEDSLAWWLSKEPLKTKPVGHGSGRTAKDLGIVTVAHETNNFLAYESITRSHTGEPNVLISRDGFPGENASYGNGFYTKTGRDGARGTDITIRFEVDPNAKEGSDFTKSGDFIIFHNKAALRVIPESLRLSPVQYFEFLESGVGIDDREKAMLEKFRRRLQGQFALAPANELKRIEDLVMDHVRTGSDRSDILLAEYLKLNEKKKDSIFAKLSALKETEKVAFLSRIAREPTSFAENGEVSIHLMNDTATAVKEAASMAILASDGKLIYDARILRSAFLRVPLKPEARIMSETWRSMLNWIPELRNDEPIWGNKESEELFAKRLLVLDDKVRRPTLQTLFSRYGNNKIPDHFAKAAVAAISGVPWIAMRDIEDYFRVIKQAEYFDAAIFRAIRFQSSYTSFDPKWLEKMGLKPEQIDIYIKGHLAPDSPRSLLRDLLSVANPVGKEAGPLAAQAFKSALNGQVDHELLTSSLKMLESTGYHSPEFDSLYIKALSQKTYAKDSDRVNNHRILVTVMTRTKTDNADKLRALLDAAGNPDPDLIGSAKIARAYLLRMKETDPDWESKLASMAGTRSSAATQHSLLEFAPESNTYVSKLILKMLTTIPGEPHPEKVSSFDYFSHRRESYEKLRAVSLYLAKNPRVSDAIYAAFMKHGTSFTDEDTLKAAGIIGRNDEKTLEFFFHILTKGGPEYVHGATLEFSKINTSATVREGFFAKIFAQTKGQTPPPATLNALAQLAHPADPTFLQLLTLAYQNEMPELLTRIGQRLETTKPWPEPIRKFVIAATAEKSPNYAVLARLRTLADSSIKTDKPLREAFEKAAKHSQSGWCTKFFGWVIGKR